jgi:hypothetical protein
MAVPGGRVLAGWWRQIGQESHGPVRALWFAHLLLHHVESLFEVRSDAGLDPVGRVLLHALALAPARTVPDLDASLHLGAAVLHRLLGDLHAVGLARPVGPAEWALTDAGRSARGQKGVSRTEEQRRVLHFVEDRPSGERAPRPPHFLNLNAHGPSPWPAGEGWQFDPAVVEGCLEQPEAWKERYGFPRDLIRLLGFQPDQWRRVILDRPEHLAALLVLSGDGPGRLAGYAVRPESWVLHSGTPAFALADGWDAVFPDLVAEPPGLWEQAWRAWCQPRALPAGEVEACTARRDGHLVRVQAPAKLFERLKAARSDAVKGEAWLVAGSGAIRPVALVELVADES